MPVVGHARDSDSVSAALGFRQPTTTQLTRSHSVLPVYRSWCPWFTVTTHVVPREPRTEEHPMSPTERLTLFLDDRDNRSLSSARIKDARSRGRPDPRCRAALATAVPRGRADQQPRRGPAPRPAGPERRPAGNDRSRSRWSWARPPTAPWRRPGSRTASPQSERVRAALHQWQQDPQFRAAVDELAAELRRQRFADRAAGGHPAALPTWPGLPPSGSAPGQDTGTEPGGEVTPSR